MTLKKEWRCPFWTPLAVAIALASAVDRYLVFFLKTTGVHTPSLVAQGAFVAVFAVVCLCCLSRITTSPWVITHEDVAGTLYPWVLAFAVFCHLGNVTRSDVEEFVILVVLFLTAAHMWITVVRGTLALRLKNRQRTVRDFMHA